MHFVHLHCSANYPNRCFVSDPCCIRFESDEKYYGFVITLKYLFWSERFAISEESVRYCIEFEFIFTNKKQNGKH